MAQSTGLYYGEDGVAQVLGCTTSSHHVVGTSRIQLRENSRGLGGSRQCCWLVEADGAK